MKKSITFISLLILCLTFGIDVYADDKAVNNTNGLQFYYSFDNTDIELNTDNTYTIKDLSGNGYDAVSDNLNVITAYEENLPHSGEAINGSFEIPKEAFSEIDSYTMNFWLVNFSSGRPSCYFLDFGDVKLSNAWGSGLCRMCSYIENEQRIYDAPDKGMVFPGKLNLYTIVKDNDEIKIYINGFYERPYFNSKSAVDFADIASKEDAQFMVNSYYMIDEMSFYNRAFSDEEVKELARIGETTLTIDNLSYDSNTLTVNVSVTNLTSDSRCIVAAYNENGILIGVSSRFTATTPNDSDSHILECSENPAYVKVYLWDSLEGLNPQCTSAIYTIS